MPWNITRTADVFEKEILRSAAGLDDIKSMVVDSTKIAENPGGSGRYVLEAGNVMGLVSGGGGKVAPIAAGAYGSGAAGAWVAADIVGILGHTVEFMIGQGVTASAKTDEPIPVLHHGCDFNVSKLVGYTGNETITKSALPTCLFR